MCTFGVEFSSSSASAGLATESLLPLSRPPLVGNEEIMNLSTYQAHLSVIKNNEVIFVKCSERPGRRRGGLSKSVIRCKHLSREPANNSGEKNTQK